MTPLETITKRLITKKEKPTSCKPRRIWVHYYSDGFKYLSEKADNVPKYLLTECVEFAEVMKGGGKKS